MQDEENQEWGTRPIYDIVKIDLFKMMINARMSLYEFYRLKDSKNTRIFQDSLLILFVAIRPHLVKRYGKLPDILEWLDHVPAHPELYKDLGRWTYSYNFISDELLEMGILNVHEVTINEKDYF